MGLGSASAERSEVRAMYGLVRCDGMEERRRESREKEEGQVRGRDAPEVAEKQR